MDYIGIRYNLTFETDTNVKVCIEIEIIADNEQEPPETLRVILNLPLPDAPHIVPGSPPEAIITIRGIILIFVINPREIHSFPMEYTV